MTDESRRRVVDRRDADSRWLVMYGAVLAVTVLTGACQDRSAPPAPVQTPAAEIEWREIGSWSGRGNRQTESFEVSPFAMRLRWQTTRETSPGAGHLTVSLHSAVSGRWLQTIVDARGVASASVNVNDEQRWCHLVIEAQDVDWQMTLEQGFSSRSR